MENETVPAEWTTITTFLQSEGGAVSALDRALLLVLSTPFGEIGGASRREIRDAMSEIRFTRSRKDDPRKKIIKPLLQHLGGPFQHSLLSECAQDPGFCELMLGKSGASFWAPNDPLLMTMIENSLDSTRNNRILMTAACTINHAALRCVSNEMKNDRDFVAPFIQRDFQALLYVSDEMKIRHTELVKTAVELFAASGWEGDCGGATHETFAPLVHSFTEALPADYFRYDYPRLDEVGRNNLQHWVEAGLPLPRAFDQHQDKEMLLLVAKHCKNPFAKHKAYDFVLDTPLESDKDFILQSVKHAPSLISYAADELWIDLDVLLEFFSALKFIRICLKYDGCSFAEKIKKAAQPFKKKAQMALDVDDYFIRSFLPLLRSKDGEEFAVSKLFVDPDTTDATLAHILGYLDELLPVDWKQKARFQRALDNLIDCGIKDPESDTRLMAPRKKDRP